MTGPLDRLDASQYGDPEGHRPPHVGPPQDDDPDWFESDDSGAEVAAELRREAEQLREGLAAMDPDPKDRQANRLIGKIEAYETIAARLGGSR